MSASSSEELVELAAVVRAHGLAGELMLKPFNPDSELLAELSEVVLRAPSGETRRYPVRSLRGGASPLLALQGVSSRDQAEALRGSRVCVPRHVLPPLTEGEYYLVDLVGLAVRNGAGEALGTVEDVIEYPSVSCLVVVTDGERREVPDLPRYLLEVRVAEGFVVVDRLDELDVVAAPPPGRR